MKNIKKVLVIRCGALGDLVYATSVIDAIKLEFGEDTLIDFVCTSNTATLFDKDNRVNTVYHLKHRKVPIWLSAQKKYIIKKSKEIGYDLLINFESGKQFKSLVEQIEAKNKVGALVEKIDNPANLTHMVDLTKNIFKSVVSDDVFSKSFPKLVGTEVETVKKKYGLPDKYLIISPSNSHQKKNSLNYRAWENRSWKELIIKLAKEVTVVIIGNKGEDEFFTELLPYPNNVIDLVGKTSLVDLIGVITGAKGLVATDTGTAHISSAVNTETFALIGPTPADVTGPYQSPTNKIHIISKNLDCSPCYKTDVMKDCTNNLCMKDISSDEVYAAIKSAGLL